MSALSRQFARLTTAALVALVLDGSPAAAQGAVPNAASYAGNSVAPSHASSRSRQRTPVVFTATDTERFHASSRTRMPSYAAITPTEAARFHASSRTRLRAVEADDMETSVRFHAFSRTRGGASSLSLATVANTQ